MKNKEKAYQLHIIGLSYKQISTQLGISKTAAYVKVGTVPGTWHLSVVLIYTGNVIGVKLRNVRTTLVSLADTIIKKSTKIGSLSGLGMVEGNWSNTSEWAGYETDVKNNVGIKYGVILKYEVKMVKKVISWFEDLKIS